MIRGLMIFLLVVSFASHARAQEGKDFILKRATITFNLPDGDDKDDDTGVNVKCFAATANGERILIAENVLFAKGTTFHDPGGPYSYEIPVKAPIKLADIQRLTAAITEYPDGDDRWIFNFTLSMEFENPAQAKKSVSLSENGIILDQENKTRDFSIWVQLPQDKLDYKLTSAKVAFDTHNDDKDDNTAVTVALAIPLNARDSIEVASLKGFAGNERFPDPCHREFVLNVETPITLDKLASSVLTVSQNTDGHDRWIFDIELIMVFSKGNEIYTISQKTFGVILDQDNRVQLFR